MKRDSLRDSLAEHRTAGETAAVQGTGGATVLESGVAIAADQRTGTTAAGSSAPRNDPEATRDPVTRHFIRKTISRSKNTIAYYSFSVFFFVF